VWQPCGENRGLATAQHGTVQRRSASADIRRPLAAATKGRTARPSSRNSWSDRQVTMPTLCLAAYEQGKSAIPNLGRGFFFGGG
jgi:hypothetical protein